jgi:hypothetical protein
LPALILDDGNVIVDSYVITEYLDELAGGGKLIPASGPARWKVKSEHSMLQGMTDAMLLCRYEVGVRPKEFLWQAWYDDQWDRAWEGLTRFENHPDILTRPLDAAQIALVCVLGYADFRFPIADGTRRFRNSTLSTTRCCSGNRSRSPFRQRVKVEKRPDAISPQLAKILRQACGNLAADLVEQRGRVIHIRALDGEHLELGLDAAIGRKSARLTAGSQHPVTRHDHRTRILPHRLPDIA